MSVVRKGLALRNIVVEKTKTVSPTVHKKESRKVPSDPTTKTTASKLPFTIYQDPEAPRCQHCGLEKTQAKIIVAKKTISTGVQTALPEADLESWLCSDDPPKEYWQSLAEQRRVALKETLDENMELCSLVEKLNAEIERLSKIAEHAESFSNAYQMIKGPSLVITKESSRPRRSL